MASKRASQLAGCFLARRSPDALSPNDPNGRRGDDGADQVCHEVPSRVLIVTDIVLGQQHHCEELDYFVEGTKSHACCGADRQHPQRRFQPASVVTPDSPSKGLPAKPRKQADAIAVNQLIVFQVAGNDSPIVEDAGGALVMPVIRNGNEPAQHVGKAPDTESPEDGATQTGTIVNSDYGNE